MFELNDVVLYGTQGVCKVEEICDKKIGGIIIQYYVLRPVSGTNITCYVPVKNEKLVAKMRPVLSRDQVENIIDSTSDIDTIWIPDDNARKAAYQQIIYDGDRTQLVALMKTLYIHQHNQVEQGKRLHFADEQLFKEAQKLICDEFGFALNISPQQVVDYIKEKSPVMDFAI